MLITGASGMVGRAVSDHCRSIGDLVLSYDHQALNIGDPDCVVHTLESDKPEVVINCAAWTDVDGCEFDKERAHMANARGPEVLALACRQLGALLITISTDYVFDGEKDGFYTISQIRWACTAPRNSTVSAAHKRLGPERSLFAADTFSEPAEQIFSALLLNGRAAANI